MDELFEQNTEERTVKFTGKFFIEDDFGKIFEGYTGCTCVSTTLDIVLEMFPKCFHECFVKMLDHGRCYGLKPTKIGEHGTKRIGIGFYWLFYFFFKKLS